MYIISKRTLTRIYQVNKGEVACAYLSQSVHHRSLYDKNYGYNRKTRGGRQRDLIPSNKSNNFEKIIH
jgi:hypothetical protein